MARFGKPLRFEQGRSCPVVYPLPHQRSVRRSNPGQEPYIPAPVAVSLAELPASPFATVPPRADVLPALHSAGDPVDKGEAEDFLRQCYAERPDASLPAGGLVARLREVLAAIDRDGTYV